LSVESDLTITVGDVNESPVLGDVITIDAVQGQEVALRVPVTDPESDTLTYSWRQISGPPVELSDADSPTPSFVAPNLEAAREVRVEVVVSDGEHEAVQQVAVNIAPGDAGAEREAELSEEADRDLTAVEPQSMPPSPSPAGFPVMPDQTVSAADAGERVDAGVTMQRGADAESAVVDERAVTATERSLGWVAQEVDEIAEIARSIAPAELDIEELARSSGRPADFEAVFASVEVGQDDGMDGEGAGQSEADRSSDGFFAKFMALMRAGFGVQSREEDKQNRPGSDRWKR
ncbi:MAG: hypothetical protein ACTS22_06880, partial [Phycisphaerales bacterium]